MAPVISPRMRENVEFPIKLFKINPNSPAAAPRTAYVIILETENNTINRTVCFAPGFVAERYIIGETAQDESIQIVFPRIIPVSNIFSMLLFLKCTVSQRMIPNQAKSDNQC